MPEGVTVLGGKTGTTNEAGNCVILYEEDAENNPYISVIMGAGDTVSYTHLDVYKRQSISSLEIFLDSTP